jgi:ABC-type Fe3+-hydroxamate transport system substrate-binding protein
MQQCNNATRKTIQQCNKENNPTMRTMYFTDQLHRTLHLPHFPPRRIISLVPSQTELLAYLGLDDEVAGITKFCVHPERWFAEKQRIGGTKTVNMEKVAALSPDLIIGNKEENDQAQIQLLEKRYPVWMSDINTLDNACDMIRSVGAITGREAKADELADKILRAFAGLDEVGIAAKTRRVAYLIWRKPMMVAASGTFTDHLLNRAGFKNAFQTQSRYPEVSADELAAAQPDLIFLSSEPYPFADKHLAEFQEICPGVPVRLVDGELFSWYGPRLLLTAPYLAELAEWS